MGGFVLGYIGGELDLAAECIGRGLSLNSNLALGWNFSGWVQMYLGNHQMAIEHARRAERLSPRDPNILQVKMAMAYAKFFGGQYEDAGQLAERMSNEFPTFAPATRIMAVSFALADNLALAQKAAKRSLKLDSSQRVALLLLQMPLRRVEDRNLWEQGLLPPAFHSKAHTSACDPSPKSTLVQTPPDML